MPQTFEPLSPDPALLACEQMQRLCWQATVDRIGYHLYLHGYHLQGWNKTDSPPSLHITEDMYVHSSIFINYSAFSSAALPSAVENECVWERERDALVVVQTKWLYYTLFCYLKYLLMILCRQDADSDLRHGWRWIVAAALPHYGFLWEKCEPLSGAVVEQVLTFLT